MRWVVTWLVGVPAVFFLIALAAHTGNHSGGGWPYLLPLMGAGIFLGVASAGLCYMAYQHSQHQATAAPDA